MRSLSVAAFSVLGALVIGPRAPVPLTPGTVSPSSPGSPAAPERTLLFVGDVMLSRSVGAIMKAREDWVYPFRDVAPTLRAADFAYCNLECPVSNRGRNQYHLYSFRADPRSIEGLKEAGFRVVSQANNHAYDWGPAALLDTLDRLHAAGIRPVGAGRNNLQAHYPIVVDLGGLKVAFLAYVNVDPREATAGVDRPGVAWLEPERVLADIRFARPLADLVVVCPHWGVEYATRPTPEQIKLGHSMIDAGADLIVGSHPHVVQPLEEYHRGWIAYSLGNFIFDQHDASTHRGAMLRVLVRDKQITGVSQVPVRINGNFQAMLAPPCEQVPRTPAVARSPLPLPAQ
jgi:poly-gamma-glutamate synthesis protein (capsule biosynthesis protein)